MFPEDDTGAGTVRTSLRKESQAKRRMGKDEKGKVRVVVRTSRTFGGKG